MFVGLTMPFIYLVFTVSAYGLFLKKRVDHVLAISFFVQILIMFITSIAFKSLTVGIFLYLFCIAIVYAIAIFRCGFKRIVSFFTSSDYVESIVFILVVYLFIYVTNYGSFFSDWDEFSHWGIFAKEMYKLDMLYCTSTVTMAHQDYVPAISIFETLWCKLSFRYSDANVYRGIQMLQASMLLPMISTFVNRKSNISFYKIVDYLAGIILVFGGLLFFGRTYHTIYQDIIYGVLVFFCMYLAISERGSSYKTLALTISLTVLVMAKMTAMAFLPMIVLFIFAWNAMFENKSIHNVSLLENRYIASVIHISVPILFWFGYKLYVESYVSTDTGQTYNGLFHSMISLINNAQDYQKEVLGNYIKALFSEGIFVRAPFVIVLIAICIAVFFIQRKQTDSIDTKRVRMIGIWIVLASIAYALMTGMLYLLLFSEYEARLLASYSRYFSTIMVADYLLLVLICFLYINSSIYKVYTIALAVIIENMIFFFDVSQLLPGKIAGDERLYSSEVEAVEKYVSEDESVIILTYGSSGLERCVLQYYCTPRDVGFISVGKTGTDDVWGQEIDIPQFVDLISGYDYVYIFEFPDSVLDGYEEAFLDTSIIQNYRLYHTEIEDGKIVLEDLE